MTRKIIALVLAVFLVIPTAFITVFADDVLTVSASSISILPGGSGTVDFTIENNPGIAGLRIKVQFDQSALSVGTVTSGSIMGAVSKQNRAYGIDLYVDSTVNHSGNGLFARVEFTTESDVTQGQYPIDITVEYAYDANDDDVDANAVDGVATVAVPDYPDLTFTAQSVTVNASNVASFRQQDGSFIVPVSVTVSGIPSDNGMAAFTLTPSSNATVSSVAAGSAIYETDQFQIGDDNKMAWVDTNEITADDSEVAVVYIAIPHNVAAGASYTVTLTPSSDPDDFLFIDLSNYDPIVVNATVSFVVSGHVAGTAANENVVAATCTATGGYDEVVRCTICGVVMSSTHCNTSALGHSFSAWTETTAATCTAAGVETRTCSRCNATETRPIAALGHNYAAVVTAPTCTAAGYTTHTCSRCQDSYTDNEVAALGHNFGTWVETTPATTVSTGVETRTCSRCGATETREIPMIVANPTFELTADPVTVKPGDTVEIALEMSDNPGIYHYSWYILYDDEAFYINDPEEDFYDAIKARDGGANISIAATRFDLPCKAMFNFFSATPKTLNGTVVIITFTVDPDAVSGDYTFTLYGDPLSSSDAVEITDVEVTVQSVLYGDADGNGIVNLADATLIAQYDLDNTIEIGAGADADGNGVINLADATLIAQYDLDNTIVLGPQA